MRMIVTILVSTWLAKACAENDRHVSCDTLAHTVSEKMYVCGILKSYELVPQMREDLQATFIQRNASNDECTTEVFRISKLSCQDFEFSLTQF